MNLNKNVLDKRCITAPALRWTRFGLLFALLFVSACTVAKPGTRFKYYSVYAENSAELTRSVARSAPRSGRAYGLTEITFVPSYDLIEKAGKCRVDNARVELALEITLPEWRKGEALPRSVRGRFKRFERYIRQHEMHHVAIAKSEAREATRRIASMSSAKGCAALRTQIKADIGKMKRRHLARHKAYDLRDARRLRKLLL